VLAYLDAQVVEGKEELIFIHLTSPVLIKHIEDITRTIQTTGLKPYRIARLWTVAIQTVGGGGGGGDDVTTGSINHGQDHHLIAS